MFGESLFHQTLLSPGLKRSVLKTHLLVELHGVASTPRPASLLALALVLALSLALSRPVLAQVLALVLSLALSGSVASLLLSFDRLSLGSLSVGVASTPRLTSLLALAPVLALSVVLPRPVVAQALALSLALSGPMVSLLLSLRRRPFVLIPTSPVKLCFCCTGRLNPRKPQISQNIKQQYPDRSPSSRQS